MSVLRLFLEKLRDCSQRVEGEARPLEDSNKKDKPAFWLFQTVWRSTQTSCPGLISHCALC